MSSRRKDHAGEMEKPLKLYQHHMQSEMPIILLLLYSSFLVDVKEGDISNLHPKHLQTPSAFSGGACRKWCKQTLSSCKTEEEAEWVFI